MSRRFLSVEDFSEGISRSRDVNTNIPFAENYRNVKSTKQSEVIIAAYTNANYNELQNYKNDITELEENKQDKLTAGNNITITDENVISSVDTTYTAGTGIDIDDDVINCTVTDTTYTAGSNIQISEENVISATDTTYSAGTGIEITDENVINNTQTSAAWGNITGNIEDQTDLMNVLDKRVNTGVTVDSNTDIFLNISKNLFNPNNYLKDMEIGSNGIISSSTYNDLFIIPVEVGKTYIFSFIDNGVSGNMVWGFSESVPVSGGSCTYNVLAITDLNGTTFTPTGNQKYLCIRLNTGGSNQYQAMSDIQCEVGIEATSYEPYIVPTIYSGGNPIFFSGVQIFSTEEQRIGTWINGKPIYRKVINFGALPNNAEKQVAHNISNLERFTKVYIPASLSNGLTIELPYYDVNTVANSITSMVSNEKVIIITKSDRSIYSAYAILEYTKTTD